MSDISVRQANVKACEVLGLDPSLVTSIEIKILPNCVATAYVEMAVTEAGLIEISSLCGVVKKFKAES